MQRTPPPPTVSIELLPPFRDATAIWDQTGRLFEFVELPSMIDFSLTTDRQGEVIEWVIQREDVASPNVWVDVEPDDRQPDAASFSNARFRIEKGIRTNELNDTSREDSKDVWGKAIQIEYNRRYRIDNVEMEEPKENDWFVDE